MDPTDHAWLKVLAKAIKGLKSDTIGILLDYNFDRNATVEVMRDKYHVVNPSHEQVPLLVLCCEAIHSRWDSKRERAGLKILCQLADRGANVDGVGSKCQTALYVLAVHGEHLDHAEALLDRGADSLIHLDRGLCPLQAAIENKKVKTVGLFLQTLSDRGILGQNLQAIETLIPDEQEAGWALRDVEVCRTNTTGDLQTLLSLS
jgi:hypothetical protein